MSVSWGLHGVETDVDDILVWGSTVDEHDERLVLAGVQKIFTDILLPASVALSHRRLLCNTLLISFATLVARSTLIELRRNTRIITREYDMGELFALKKGKYLI